MPHKGKGINSRYDPADLEKAVLAVHGGLSVRKAAAHFNVPRSTIHDRISGRISIGVSPGKQTVFPRQVEQILADKMKLAAQMGFGIDRKQLKAKAARLAAQLKLKTPFKNGVPGDDWVNAFLKRNKLSLRAQIALSTVRSRMLNKTVCEKYFVDLEKLMNDLNLSNKPNLVWNMDETSVSLTHKPTKVLAQKGSRNVPGRVGNSRESVTVLASVNGAGADVPPMVIVKGKTPKALNGFNVSEGPYGTCWTYQNKGWMEESLGTEWFKTVFVPNIGPERPQLLLLDSHSSHETLDIIECAIEENITMLALPPHTTQYLNPLDKTVFGPFSNEYNRQCTEFMAKSPNNLVCKWVWPSLFKLAYERSFTKHNISTGFVKCGVCPVSMDAIPLCAFMPSNAFDVQPQTDVPAPTPVDVPAISASVNESEPSNHIENYTSVEQAPPIHGVETLIATADQDGTSVVQTPFIPSQATLIATADQDGTVTLEAVTAEEVLQAIMDSGVERDIEISSEVPLATASEQIESLFSMPVPDRKQTCGTKRKLTSHRILTSEEIVRQKKEAKLKKETEIKLKEERKVARQNKIKVNSNKKVKKVKVEKVN